MRMKIPQPIQLWFNKFNSRKYLSQSSDPNCSEFAELNSFLHTQKTNPLLIIGLSNLIMETVSSYPPPDGAVEVLTLVCSQLLSFYRHKLEEVRTITLESIPALIYVYLYLTAHADLSEFDVSSWSKSDKKGTSATEEFDTQADGKSQENAANDEKYVTVVPSPLPRMKNYMAKKIHKQSTVIYRSLRLDHRSDRALDSVQIIGALESLFIGVYNTSIARRSLDPSAQQRMCTMPLLSYFETIYSDPLTKPKAAESTDTKGPYVRGRSNESGSPSSVEECDVLLDEAFPYNRYKFIKGAVFQSSRMRLLTYLLFLVRDEVKTLPDHVHGTLYRLALMLHPVVKHTRNRPPGLREQGGLRKNPVRTDANEQGDRTTENPSEAFDQPKTPSRANSEEDDEPSDKEPLRMDKLEKSRHKTLRSPTQKDRFSTRSVGTDVTYCPRLQGLQPEFLTELLHCIQRIIRPDMVQLHSAALDALEARANYELWTAPLLLIDAIRDLSNRPVATSARFMSDAFVRTTYQQSSGMEKNQQTTPTSELNPQQLSLASAYCGLWSDLVEKRELTKSNTAISTKDVRQSEMVRLAQNKFMRSIVTNANFRTHKPPDDITITQDHYRRSSGPPTQQSDQNKLSLVRDIEQWEGKIEDLVIEEKRSLTSPKSWLRKLGNPGQKLPKSERTT